MPRTYVKRKNRQRMPRAPARREEVTLVELLDLNAKIHFDTSELDDAIEKANRLLALLQEAQKTAGSQDGEN